MVSRCGQPSSSLLWLLSDVRGGANGLPNPAPLRTGIAQSFLVTYFSNEGVAVSELSSAFQSEVHTLPSERASIIFRCSPEQAAKVRHLAATNRRTVAGYLLSVLDRNLTLEERYHEGYTPYMAAQSREFRAPFGPRTAIHLRCSSEEANRIRRAATRRQMSISRFIIFSLERSWRAVDHVRQSNFDTPHD